MNKEVFQALPNNKRCELVWEEGQFLTSIKHQNFKANLYALQSFFVEILCYTESTKIENVEIASEEKLAKYLNSIDITNLL